MGHTCLSPSEFRPHATGCFSQQQLYNPKLQAVPSLRDATGLSILARAARRDPLASSRGEAAFLVFSCTPSSQTSLANELFFMQGKSNMAGKRDTKPSTATIISGKAAAFSYSFQATNQAFSSLVFFLMLSLMKVFQYSA